MSKPLLRIPYTGTLPAPLIIPPSAASVSGATAALAQFLSSPPPLSRWSADAHQLRRGTLSSAAGPGDTDTGFASWRDRNTNTDTNTSTGTSGITGIPGGGGTTTDGTVLLTGAGLSVASGLADYRGENGTYTQNKSYRPIYFHEFVGSHASRRRYWARSFLGWRGLHRGAPNAGHRAIRDLARLGYLRGVVTQNVDSFHHIAHPALRTVELHGALRALVCLSCGHELDRETFQGRLAALNPRWAAFLQDLLASGALDTENPAERRRRGLRTNPDGDVDAPGVEYAGFRYPACPRCVRRPPLRADGSKAHVVVDADGAWDERSGAAGVLKPNVIMFGESIPAAVKGAAEQLVDGAARLLVVGSSLATYSAWRLVKRASDNGIDIGILNVGGVRKEEAFLKADGDEGRGHLTVRASLKAEEILPAVVRALGGGGE